jgi:hypothetical protein
MRNLGSIGMGIPAAIHEGWLEALAKWPLIIFRTGWSIKLGESLANADDSRYDRS